MSQFVTPTGTMPPIVVNGENQPPPIGTVIVKAGIYANSGQLNQWDKRIGRLDVGLWDGSNHYSQLVLDSRSIYGMNNFIQVMSVIPANLKPFCKWWPDDNALDSTWLLLASYEDI